MLPREEFGVLGVGAETGSLYLGLSGVQPGLWLFKGSTAEFSLAAELRTQRSQSVEAPMPGLGLAREGNGSWLILPRDR